MKYLLLLSILITSTFALSINESLLKVHAVLVPKIYLMDYGFKEKLQNNSIIISLLYDASSYKSAVSLKNKIDGKYRDGIKGHSVKVKLTAYNSLANTQANIYYLFPTDRQNIKEVIKKANSNHALTFSYLNDDLKYGIMLSLKVGKRVKPIINLDAIKLHNITFRPVLLKISKIYMSRESSRLNLYREIVELKGIDV